MEFLKIDKYIFLLSINYNNKINYKLNNNFIAY